MPCLSAAVRSACSARHLLQRLGLGLLFCLWVHTPARAGVLEIQFGHDTQRLQQASQPASLQTPNQSAVPLGPALRRQNRDPRSLEIAWFSEAYQSKAVRVALGLNGHWQTPARYFGWTFDELAGEATASERYSLRALLTRSVQLRSRGVDLRLRGSWQRYRVQPFVDVGVGWVRNEARVSDMRALGTLTAERGVEVLRVDFNTTIRSARWQHDDALSWRVQAGFEMELGERWVAGLAYRLRDLGAFTSRGVRSNASEAIAFSTTFSFDDQLQVSDLRSSAWLISFRYQTESRAVSIR